MARRKKPVPLCELCEKHPQMNVYLVHRDEGDEEKTGTLIWLCRSCLDEITQVLLGASST